MPRINKKETPVLKEITEEIPQEEHVPEITTKKERKPNPWLEHVKTVRAEKVSEGKTYKEVLSIAKASYKK